MATHSERLPYDLILVMAGHYEWVSRQPETPGLPAIRAHQRRMAGLFRAWLTRRR